MINSSIKAGIVCLVSLATCGLSTAQTRTMNTNSPGVLRSWPPDGKWQVILVHTVDNRYTCLTVTAHNADGNEYFFGVEAEAQALHILVGDRNPQAVAGDTVKALVDNTIIGTYSVDKRTSGGGLSQVRALVPSDEANKLLNLLKVGGDIQVETDEATYSASLDGMTNALDNVANCLTEAGALAAGS